MLSVVYMYHFENIKGKNKYIGSVANCKIKDGLIYKTNDKLYRGSSSDVDYFKLWGSISHN